jgi:hypothetical protein
MIRAARGVMLAFGLSASVAAIVPAQTPPPTTPPPVPRPFPGSNPPPTAPPSKTNPTQPASPTPAPPAQTAPPQTPPAQTTPPPAAPVQTPPAQPAATTSRGAAPSEASLGVRFFPDAEFLESFDAGLGQTLFLFGTNAPYPDVVAFYKKELGTSGTELFKVPPMQQFDLDKFQEEKMVYRPSVVVKDYTWTGINGELKDGYLFVDGRNEKRYRTIVQIVPAPVK